MGTRVRSSKQVRPRELPPLDLRTPTGRAAAVMIEGTSATRRESMCEHGPCCPAAEATDWSAAKVVSAHPEQGWSLLCNGVVFFDDLAALLPDGHVVSLAPSSVAPAQPGYHAHDDAPVKRRR
jgi:hypothetical protein